MNTKQCSLESACYNLCLQPLFAVVIFRFLNQHIAKWFKLISLPCCCLWLCYIFM